MHLNILRGNSGVSAQTRCDWYEINVYTLSNKQYCSNTVYYYVTNECAHCLQCTLQYCMQPRFHIRFMGMPPYVLFLNSPGFMSCVCLVNKLIYVYLCFYLSFVKCHVFSEVPCRRPSLKSGAGRRCVLHAEGGQGTGHFLQD